MESAFLWNGNPTPRIGDNRNRSSLITELRQPRHALRPPIAACVVATLVLGGGLARIVLAPNETQTVVALIAVEQPRQLPSDWRSVLATYQPRFAEAAALGARIIVLPEEISHVSEVDMPAVRARLASWTRSAGATLAIGFRVGADGSAHNRLIVFDASGRERDYDKVHLIPGVEAGEVIPGRRPPLLSVIDGVPIGGAICKDFDFAAIGHQLAGEGAKIVVAPAWDFGIDGWLHSRMAILRGVESGFTLLRSARRGEMTASDRFGRVLASRPSTDNTFLMAKVPIPIAPLTLYARIGDVFGWACLAVTALIMIGLTFARLNLRCRRSDAEAISSTNIPPIQTL